MLILGCDQFVLYQRIGGSDGNEKEVGKAKEVAQHSLDNGVGSIGLYCWAAGLGEMKQ